jgi:hypothetical protein
MFVAAAEAGGNVSDEGMEVEVDTSELSVELVVAKLTSVSVTSVGLVPITR